MKAQQLMRFVQTIPAQIRMDRFHIDSRNVSSIYITNPLALNNAKSVKLP